MTWHKLLDGDGIHHPGKVICIKLNPLSDTIIGTKAPGKDFTCPTCGETLTGEGEVYKQLTEVPISNKPLIKVRRNNPCPCGSGKKFKKCHGKDGSNYYEEGKGNSKLIYARKVKD